MTSKITYQRDDQDLVFVKGRRYEYNLQNRLAQIWDMGTDESSTTDDELLTEYSYNTAGIRTEKIDHEFTPEQRATYLIDPANQTGYAQVLEETTYEDDGQGDWTPLSRIYYTIGDDVLAQTTATYSGGWSAGTAQYLLYDGHGSTRQLARPDQSIQQSYNYDAYGTLLQGAEVESNPGITPQMDTSLLYAGEQFDTDAQQYYLRARYYNPANGLFNRVDPYAGNMQDPQSLHKYLYCHNNPVNNIDPTGRSKILEITTQLAIRALITSVVFGLISFIFAKAKGATWLGALWTGFKTAAITGMAMLSPIFAWCLLAIFPILIALNIYTGDLTGKDIPEIVTYIAAGILLMLLFKSPGYKIWETKTVIKTKIPQALKNLETGTTMTPKTARVWNKAKMTGRKSVQGICIHKELADIMRNEGMSNLGIEVSYNSSGEIVGYGTKGSIRTDYVVYHKGQAIKVFDLKPNDIISGTWLKKTTQYMNLSAEDIEAISYGGNL